jgi:hypothetical protein
MEEVTMYRVTMSHDFSRQMVKAKLYYDQPDQFQRVGGATFKWVNDEVSYELNRKDDGSWQCQCHYARNSQYPCAHARALERLIADGRMRWTLDSPGRLLLAHH